MNTLTKVVSRGLIDKTGRLVIERAGVMIRQCCPFPGHIFCSDGCPHFGEPNNMRNGKTSLVLGCGNAYLVFTDFTDERTASPRLERYLEECEKYPDATIEVDR